MQYGKILTNLNQRSKKDQKVTCSNNLLALSWLSLFLGCKQGTMRSQSYATNKLPGELEKDCECWNGVIMCHFIVDLPPCSLTDQTPKLWNCVGCEHDMSNVVMHWTQCLLPLWHVAHHGTSATRLMSSSICDMHHQGTLPPCRQCHSRDWVEHGRLRAAGAMRPCAWQEQRSAFEVWITLFITFPCFSIFLIVCFNAAQPFSIHDLDSPALGLGNDSGRSNSFLQGFRGT